MAKIEVATFEQLATILTQLATNYSNIFDDYYNMFYNEEEKEIVLQLYNSEGKIDTIRVPNRAMDRKYIKNGEGSPDGVLSAVRGTIYQDLINGDLYLKQSGDGGPFGWYRLLSESKLEDILMRGYGSPVGVVTASRGTLYVDKSSGVVYVKIEETGSVGWEPITASASLFAYNDLTNLSTVGESHFANPSLSNLDGVGRDLMNSKQDQAYRVLSDEGITSTCTDDQYPSAKATYEYVNDVAITVANKQLSNLEPEGEEHFLGKPQIKDGIIYAPNGLPYVNPNSSTLSIPAGTIVLGANGLDRLGSNKNDRKVIQQPSPSVTVSIGNNKDGIVFYDLSNDTLRYVELSGYSRINKAPSGKQNMIWYNPDTNVYKVTTNSGTVWTDEVLVEIARFKTNGSGVISEFYPYHPISVATKDDLYNKANSDLSNVVDIKQIHAVLVDDSRDSTTSWYRITDDGYVEQVWRANISNGQTVTLPIPLRDGNYFVVGIPQSSGVWCSCYSHTTNGFNVYVSSTGTVRFYACGFRA